MPHSDSPVAVAIFYQPYRAKALESLVMPDRSNATEQ